MTKVILHIHNVALVGGVPAFIADLARAFPEFFHIALHLNGSREEPGAIQLLNDNGVRAFLCPTPVTPEALAQFDPVLVMWHNIAGGSLSGEWPWSWIRSWPSISWHHSSVTPTPQTDWHIFVSEYVKKQYQGLLDSKYISRWKVVPPCISTGDFDHPRNYGRPQRPEDVVLGKVSAPFNKDKYPAELLVMLKHLGCKMLFPNAEKWWGRQDQVMSPWPNWYSVRKWLQRMDIFVYINAARTPETWCRAVTEAMASGLPIVAENRGGIAEQIQNEKTGFLIEHGAWRTAEGAIRTLMHDEQLRAELGMGAKAWAQVAAGHARLRRELDGVLLGLILEAV